MAKIRNGLPIALLAASLCAGGAFAAELSLGNAAVAAKGQAKAFREDGGLHVSIDSPRGDSRVELLPPKGEFWDLSKNKFFAADVENLSKTKQLRLNVQLKAAGADKKDAYFVAGIALNPGERRTLRFALPHASLNKSPKGVPGPKTLDTAKVKSVELFMQWPFEADAEGLLDCMLSNPRGEGEYDAGAKDAKAFAPFIDPYGQYAHSDWPEKIHSDAELKLNLAKEAKELAETKAPADWDAFGGWAKGPQLKATGSFRVEKYQGKWYFVDPAGRLFLSQGIDVLMACSDSVKSKGREDWFEKLPAGAETWQPIDSNLKIKYGKNDYQDEFYKTLAKRLTSWGINTIGDWGSADLMKLGKIPYTLQLTDFDYKTPRLGNLKAYDVFAPAYVEKMKNLVSLAARKNPIVAKSLKDPLCIGYFIDNELNFGNRGKLSYIDEIMKGEATMPAKLKLREWLKERHGSFARLDDAWGTDYKNGAGFLSAKTAPQKRTAACEKDLRDFLDVMLDQYFRLCREAVKSVAPDRLYLGCRFISTDAVRPELYKACAKYADVLSVNIYAHGAANFPDEGFPDVPVLIGEFHFGIGDRGLFSPGLCVAGATPEDRALAYVRFMQGALAHPKIVGAHWFQFRDQPLIGRWDGEGYQIGFVDVCDTPYPEMARASREIAGTMYDIKAGGALPSGKSNGR